ncbi:hypothetical protein ACFTAO_37445 [Paenibacillus rhizoplanae]
MLSTQFMGRITVEPAMSAMVAEAVSSQSTQKTAVSCGERSRINWGELRNGGNQQDQKQQPIPVHLDSISLLCG